LMTLTIFSATPQPPPIPRWSSSHVPVAKEEGKQVTLGPWPYPTGEFFTIFPPIFFSNLLCPTPGPAGHPAP
jgi:hypothetical protein